MRIGGDLAVDVWMADVSHYVFKISVKVKVMNDVNFPDRNLLFYIYASLVAFLEWITHAQTHLSIKRDWREFLFLVMEL